MLHFGRNTRVTVGMDMLPRGSSGGSSGSHGMGMVCQSCSLCRYLYISFGESLCSLPQNSGKRIQEWEKEKWEISLGSQREDKKWVKWVKRCSLKHSFFQAQASHQKAGAEGLVVVKESRFYHRGGCIQPWGRIAGPAHPGSPGLLSLSSASWELEGDHKPPSTVASFCSWGSSCQCAIILDITALKIVPVFFLASLLFSGALKI